MKESKAMQCIHGHSHFHILNHSDICVARRTILQSTFAVTCSCSTMELLTCFVLSD